MGMVMESSATGVCVSVSLYLRTFFGAGFAIFCLLHHPHHPFWQKNMTKQPGPLQNSNPCAKGPLYLYKVQIHVQHDTSTTTKFKSMCKMTLLQNSNPGIPTQSWASTKFKSMSKQNPTKPRVKPKKHSTKFRPQVHTKTPSLKPPNFEPGFEFCRGSTLLILNLDLNFVEAQLSVGIPGFEFCRAQGVRIFFATRRRRHPKRSPGETYL